MQPIHTLNFIDKSNLSHQDQVVAFKDTVANVIGGSAGAAVTTAVAFVEPVKTPYQVFATPNQDAVAHVTNKTAMGFDLVLRPRLATDTLAVGTVDVLVLS